VDSEGYSPGSGHRFNGTETVFIDHESPRQNAWVASFNGRLRHELIDFLIQRYALRAVSGPAEKEGVYWHADALAARLIDLRPD
jgi:hypothetical protein